VADPELALAHAGGAPLLAAALDDEYWHARQRLLERIRKTDFDPLSAADDLKDVAPAQLVILLQKWSFDLVSPAGRRHGPLQSGPLRPVWRSWPPASNRVEVLRFHRRMVGCCSARCTPAERAPVPGGTDAARIRRNWYVPAHAGHPA